MILGQTMASSSVQQSQDEDHLQIERNIANEIMDTVHRLQLPFKLEQLTEGLGNCFPIAIIQQLRRPEKISQLRAAPKRLVSHKTGHSLLRQSVHQLIMKSRSPRVVLFKAQYEETDGRANKESWNQYWERMTTDRTWIDYWFVQATAWYLQLDIWIIATSSTETSPYIEVSGNLADGNKPSGGPIITLGTKSNSHYQSLLPIEMFHLEFPQNQPSNAVPEAKGASEEKMETQGMCDKEIKTTQDNEPNKSLQTTKCKKNEDKFTAEKRDNSESNQPFIYKSNQKPLVFLCMSEDYIMKCPMCHIDTKLILRHIKNKNCKITEDLTSFKEQFRLYKEKYRKGKKRKCMEAIRLKQRAEDEDKVKEQQRKHQAESLKKKRAEDNVKVKEQQRKRQEESRMKKRAEDDAKVREQQRKHQEESTMKKRAEDNAKVKEQQRKRQ
jgi:hypothetical protein